MKAILAALAAVGLAAAAHAAPAPATFGATLAWDPPVTTGTVGYVVYWGSGALTSSRDVGNVTTAVVTGLTWSVSYQFSVTAYDSQHIEGDYATPLVQRWVRPGKPTLKSVILKLFGL